ncbi:hypothetical protein COOONC_23198 [Cooperia oncophora]
MITVKAFPPHINEMLSVYKETQVLPIWQSAVSTTASVVLMGASTLFLFAALVCMVSSQKGPQVPQGNGPPAYYGPPPYPPPFYVPPPPPCLFGYPGGFPGPFGPGGPGGPRGPGSPGGPGAAMGGAPGGPRGPGGGQGGPRGPK